MERQIMAINNQGVQILLNRMESHPEEFTNGPYAGVGRWDWVIDGVVARVENKHKPINEVERHAIRVPFPFLTNEEVEALYDKFMSIRGDAFTHRIMRELLEEEEPEQSELEQRKLVISPAMLEQIKAFAKR